MEGYIKILFIMVSIIFGAFCMEMVQRVMAALQAFNVWL